MSAPDSSTVLQVLSSPTLLDIIAAIWFHICTILVISVFDLNTCSEGTCPVGGKVYRVAANGWASDGQIFWSEPSSKLLFLKMFNEIHLSW
jgi:hypothetical protein